MRIATKLAGGDAVASALCEIRRLLATLPETPKLRALRGRVESYETIVVKWSAVPPTAAQCSAMLECVTELLTKISLSHDPERFENLPAPARAAHGVRKKT